MKRRPRIDQDAHLAQWPLLFETGMPAGKDFTQREDELLIQLDEAWVEKLAAMARRYGSSPAGFSLLILFDFLYGYYLLARMRREKFGLFKGFPAHDPTLGTAFSIDAEQCLHLMVPRRLWLDLESIAQRQNLPLPELAGLIIQRFLEGHLGTTVP